MPRRLCIVSRADNELFVRLTAAFAGKQDVTVIRDRRCGERRRRGPAEAGRRREDRAPELARLGWFIVDLDGADAAADAAAVLEAATPVADVLLGGRRHLIDRFPYVIERGDDPWGNALVCDDRLALPDREPYQVSRRHCVVVRDARELAVVDTTSRLGTVVNGALIGGRSGRIRAPLRRGVNHVAVGGPHTRYAFRLVC